MRLRGTLCPDLLGTSPVNACYPDIIINSIFFHSQMSPCLDDKEYHNSSKTAFSKRKIQSSVQFWYLSSVSSFYIFWKRLYKIGTMSSLNILEEITV